MPFIACLTNTQRRPHVASDHDVLHFVEPINTQLQKTSRLSHNQARETENRNSPVEGCCEDARVHYPRIKVRARAARPLVGGRCRGARELEALLFAGDLMSQDPTVCQDSAVSAGHTFHAWSLQSRGGSTE